MSGEANGAPDDADDFDEAEDADFDDADDLDAADEDYFDDTEDLDDTEDINDTDDLDDEDDDADDVGDEGQPISARRDDSGRKVLLQLEDVSRVYGEEVKVYAMRTVSLKIYAGDFMAIVGPSGSGKSTMLGLLGCLDLATEGIVRVGGQNVNELDDAARSKLRGDSIGFVFQQFHLIPHLTAQKNVETALLYRGFSASQRRKKAAEALDRVGLGPRGGHRPVQLSGGEQQRVALARAIVTDPLMVLADEPTGALDTKNAENVMEIFTSLVSPERALVMVTHDLEVAAMAERRVSMRDGEIEGDIIQTPGAWERST